MPVERRKDPNKVIAQRREGNNLRNIPDILIPIWQIKIRERFGIDVDREIARYIVLAAHEEGTWKKQRAVRKIEDILRARGMSRDASTKVAVDVIKMAIGGKSREE
ncbi:MAG: hypothetical protein M1597_02175 [Candidatus Thermoplasmatota archaeon]|nr:hypothetical protein [Candidatus Thermoplasmatota archaeon]